MTALRAVLVIPWRVLAIAVIGICMLYGVYSVTGVAQFVEDVVIDDRPTPNLVFGFAWERWHLALLLALLIYLPTRVRLSSRHLVLVFVAAPVMLELFIRRSFVTRGMRLYPTTFSVLALVSFLLPMALLGLIVYWMWGRRAPSKLIPRLPTPLWRWLSVAVLAGAGVAAGATLAADDSWCRVALRPSYLALSVLGGVLRRQWAGAVMAFTFVFYAVACLGCAMDLQSFANGGRWGRYLRRPRTAVRDSEPESQAAGADIGVDQRKTT